jgi:hypothetical protein
MRIFKLQYFIQTKLDKKKINFRKNLHKYEH